MIVTLPWSSDHKSSWLGAAEARVEVMSPKLVAAWDEAHDRRRMGRPLSRPGVVARHGPAYGLQVQQRALAARRGDRDPQQVDHPVGAELAGLLQRHPLQLLGGDRGRGLGDRAAVAVEAQILDPSV